MSKKALQIQIDKIEREKLEALASGWGLSLAGAIRRLIREFEDGKS